MYTSPEVSNTQSRATYKNLRKRKAEKISVFQVKEDNKALRVYEY